MIAHLYTDGGVIQKNPSPIGGTWAYCIVIDNIVHSSGSGVIGVSSDWPTVSNNYSEMMAMIRGLEAISTYRVLFDVSCDSAVTIGRIVNSYAWRNLPNDLVLRYQKLRERFNDFKGIDFVQLDGHPTRDQLRSGIGHRGHPVSQWNVWCDKQCRESGDLYLKVLNG